jgi:hypothetical protein
MIDFLLKIITGFFLNYPFSFIIWMITGFQKDRLEKIINNGYRLNTLIISLLALFAFLIIKLFWYLVQS